LGVVMGSPGFSVDPGLRMHPSEVTETPMGPSPGILAVSASPTEATLGQPAIQF
jgi:hypothetical protein